MPTDVRCLVETNQPYPVVRLVGGLDVAAASEVRSALLDCLAEQPEGVVVDVSGLRVADRAALSVFTELASEAADWPAARILFCVSGDDSTDLWSTTALALCPSPQAALAALGEPAPLTRLSADLEPVIGAARRARELVTEACGRWDLAELAGPGCIVVTEMVNNVVAHARTPMTIMLALRGGALTVAVRDGSPVPPKFGGPVSPTSYGGRGLLLIDSVARRWGTMQVGDGKVVWAALYSEDEAVDGDSAGRPGA